MTAREDKIRQIVSELDVQVAEIGANIAALKAVLAEDGVPETETAVKPEATPGSS